MSRIAVIAGSVCLLLVAPVAVAEAQDAEAPAARHLTLDEAQRTSVQANAAMAQLGQLGVEAAEHHRRGVESDYFPKISATAWNLHFDKFMGQQIGVVRPFAGGIATLGVPLFGQDQSFVSINGIQPLTPM